MNIELLKADPQQRKQILAMLENNLQYMEQVLAMSETIGLTVKPYMRQEVAQMKEMIAKLKEMP